MINRVLIGATLAVASLPSAAQVPPAPSPIEQRPLGEKLIRAIKTKDLNAYSSLLSEDLLVFEDGKEISNNKNSWLKAFGKKLAADGVLFDISSGYTSSNRILLIEYFNSSPSWGGRSPSHCCWSYDAVSYEIICSKISVIRRLSGGSIKLDKNGTPEF